MAAIPRAPLREALPGRVRVDLTRPADSFDPGHTLAHEAKCPAVGNLLMSAPVSAIMTSATLVEIPGIVEIRSRAPRKGSITTSMKSNIALDNSSLVFHFFRSRSLICMLDQNDSIMALMPHMTRVRSGSAESCRSRAEIDHDPSEGFTRVESLQTPNDVTLGQPQIGRASCRE